MFSDFILLISWLTQKKIITNIAAALFTFTKNLWVY